MFRLYVTIKTYQNFKCAQSIRHQIPNENSYCYLFMSIYNSGMRAILGSDQENSVKNTEINKQTHVKFCLWSCLIFILWFLTGETRKSCKNKAPTGSVWLH